MATYRFKNINSGEILETEMSVHALDEYKQANPHLHQLVTGFACVSNLSSTNKTPDGFRDLLGNIHRNTAGSTLSAHNN